MPRLARESLENEMQTYHILIEGVTSESVFQSNRYKENYLKILCDKKDEYNISIFAYSILNNHAHLILKSDSSDNISKFIKSVNTIYARFFNKTNDRQGYVFRGRFKSEPLENQEKIKNCITFLHFNPVSCKIARKIEDYEFTSFNDLKSKNDRIIDIKSLNKIINDLTNFDDKIEIKFLDDEFEHTENNDFVDNVLTSLIKKYNIKTMNDLKDTKTLGLLAGELKEKCKVSLVDLQTILEINRETIRLAINKYYKK